MHGPKVKDIFAKTFKTHEQPVVPPYFSCIQEVRLVLVIFRKEAKQGKQGKNFLVVYDFNFPVIAHFKRIHKGLMSCMILEAFAMSLSFLVGNNLSLSAIIFRPLQNKATAIVPCLPCHIVLFNIVFYT